MLNYETIYRHYENCYEKHGDNNKGVDWPNPEDARVRYKIMLDVINFDVRSDNSANKAVLDLGCGLAHLYEYISSNNIDVSYTGMDISKVFVDSCKNKYPDIRFINKDLLEEDFEEKFDYVIMNGVFTEKLQMSYEDMWKFFTTLITRAFEICDRGIAFNVMSKDVDWERDDLFHVPHSDLSSFIVKNLSRNYIMRSDYGLYEYTVYVYKEPNR